MVAPKGINANFISLKCCLPKGIPIIVIQRITPQDKCSSESGIPVVSSQMIFKIREGVPPPKLTSFPNGKKERLANLKHCIPIGIPIMVIHQRIPTKNQLRPLSNPPQKNQRIFPRHPIQIPPSDIYFIICANHEKCNIR